MPLSVAKTPTGRHPIGLARLKTLASENAKPPEGFKTVDAPGSNNNNDDVLTLEEGQAILGKVLRVETEKTEYGNNLYTFEDEDRGVIDWYGNKQVDSRYEAGGFAKGDLVWIHKSTEVESFQTDDGEDVTYNLYEVRVSDGGD